MITPRIPYTLLTLTGLITLAKRTISTLKSQHPEETFFGKNIQKLEAAQNLASRAANSTTRLAGTKDVTAADRDRDNSVDSLKAHIKAGLKRNNSAYREACERLFAIFEKNGLAISDLPYDQQTGALISLMEDLGTPQAQADLATINATEWLEELKTDQESFELAVLDRSQEKSTHDVPTDAEAQAAIIPALKGMYRTLDVAEENELVENISATISQINVIIGEIVVAHRR